MAACPCSGLVVIGTPGMDDSSHLLVERSAASKEKVLFSQDKALKYYQNPTLERYCKMRYTDPEEPVSYTDCKVTSSLDLTFDQGEPHIFTGEHCLKALILCMESHWHKPVSQIKTLLYHLKPCFKMDS